MLLLWLVRRMIYRHTSHVYKLRTSVKRCNCTCTFTDCWWSFITGLCYTFFAFVKFVVIVSHKHLQTIGFLQALNTCLFWILLVLIKRASIVFPSVKYKHFYLRSVKLSLYRLITFLLFSVCAKFYFYFNFCQQQEKILHLKHFWKCIFKFLTITKYI